MQWNTIPRAPTVDWVIAATVMGVAEENPRPETYYSFYAMSMLDWLPSWYKTTRVHNNLNKNDIIMHSW